MSPDRSRAWSAAVVIVVGAGTLVIHVAHVLRGEPTMSAFVSGTLLPALLSAGLVLIGGWMLGREENGEFARRMATWCVLGCLGLGVAGGTIVFYQNAAGGTIVNPLFVIANTATGGAVGGVLVGVYDAERKRTEDRLVAERERADQLKRRLTVLNRVLRHDIRNDVNVIMGVASLLRNDGTDVAVHADTIEEKATEMHRMSEAARRVERLVEQDEAVRPVEVVGILEAQVEEYDAERPHAEIELDGSGEAWVSASPMLDMAVENVIENAIEHHDGEQPTVEISVDHVVVGGEDHVEVSIADDGPGIPEREIEVLERGRETQLQHSNGIGLWMVNWIVAESNGEVVFETNDPRGSVVVLRIPAIDPDAHAGEVAAGTGSTAASG